MTKDARTELFDALDDSLVALRGVPRRPGYRRRILEGLDVPGGAGTIRALRTVERWPDPGPSIGEVAERLGLDPSTMSRVIERCVAAGMLVRVADAEDRRRSHLRLTEPGRELISAASRNRRLLLAEVTRDWQPDDLRRLLDLLHELLEDFAELEDRS